MLSKLYKLIMLDAEQDKLRREAEKARSDGGNGNNDNKNSGFSHTYYLPAKEESGSQAEHKLPELSVSAEVSLPDGGH